MRETLGQEDTIPETMSDRSENAGKTMAMLSVKLVMNKKSALLLGRQSSGFSTKDRAQTKPGKGGRPVIPFGAPTRPTPGQSCPETLRYGGGCLRDGPQSPG